MYKGTLGFGLVSIPVAIHRAIAKKNVRFHELHAEDGGRIQRRTVCEHGGHPVSREHIVKGFEIERGRHVQVLPSEIEALEPSASRRIEIDAFVDPGEIDPLLYDRSYYLVPAEGAGRSYALLREAMVSRRKVAVARMVLRSKQIVAVIRPTGPVGKPGTTLAISILDYADELLPEEELEGLPGPEVLLGDREISLAERLVDLYAARFEPERYHDEHREKLLAFLEKKAEGKPIEMPPRAAEPAPERNLVGALEASLSEAERQKRAA
ncbi:Ku domain protein [Minicystis rosea]|nr:Ku domain protein [Minicystis rosea]